MEGTSSVRNAGGLGINSGRVRELQPLGYIPPHCQGLASLVAVSGMSVRLWYYALRKTEAH